MMARAKRIAAPERKPRKPRKPGSGGAREGAGRKPFVPTEEQRRVVEMGAAFGLTKEQIMLMVINPRTKLPIGNGTLHRIFQGELDRGHPKAVFAVAASLFNNATKHNNVTAQIYFLKTVGRWVEAPLGVNATIAHTGAGLGDIGEQLVSAIARLRANGAADEEGNSESYGRTTH